MASTGKETKFPNGIINESSQENLTPDNLVTQDIDGVQGVIPIENIEKTANKTSTISGYSETLYPNEKASHDALDLKLNISDLPTNLTLYPTTTASDVSGYVVMVKDIHDVRYNTTAVDVSTPTITTTDQLVSQRISDAGVLIGQPGVFNITTFGNIRHLSGSGTATFYFKVFHRDSSGVETLICTSSISSPVTDGGYSEFTASGVWDDGDFVASDRIVIKSYANRIAGGSDPVYQFQFGGASPVRTLLPVPFSVVDAGYELSANKQNSLAIDGTGTKYPTVDAVNTIPFNNVEVTDVGDKKGVFAIVGDSFSVGSGSTTFANRFSTIVSNSILNSSNGYGYFSIINLNSALLTTTGTYISSGVVSSRLSLSSGQSITITGKVARYYDVIYDASLSTGSLEFRLNGILLFTKTISGTGLKTTFPTIIGGANTPVLQSDIVTITSVGGTVVVTSVENLKQAIDTPKVYVIAKSGTGYQDYVSTSNLDEIAYYLNSREGVKTVLLALGTNNMYSASKHLTPEQTTDNITLFINGITSRCGASNFIITIPAKSDEIIFPIQESGYTYEDYVNHIYKYCKDNGHTPVRYDQTKLGTGDSNYLSDGVHPNDVGHKILANKINETLNITTKVKTTHWEPTFIMGTSGEINASGHINEVVLSLGDLANKTIISDTPTSTNTGGVSEVLMHTYTIAGDKLPTSCMPNLKVKISKSGTVGTVSLRIKVNTVNDFSTATQIALYTSATATNIATFVRNLTISSGSMYVNNATISLINDEAASTSGSSTITYDPSVTQYWFVSLQNSDSTDTTRVRSIKLVN